MQKRATEVLTSLAALATLAFGAIALAQDTANGSVPAANGSAGSAPKPPFAAAGSGLLLAKPLDDAALAANRGGAQLSDMKLEGVVAENSAVAIGATGTNVISQGAFANSTGVPMVVQNSGNNVLIQNATIVNVEVK